MILGTVNMVNNYKFSGFVITIKALRVLMVRVNLFVFISFQTSTINSAKIGSKMILSTVNLVNNYKFSDFIITKITEEQKEIDIESLKRNKRHSLGAPSKRVSQNFEFYGLYVLGVVLLVYRPLRVVRWYF